MAAKVHNVAHKLDIFKAGGTFDLTKLICCFYKFIVGDTLIQWNKQKRMCDGACMKLCLWFVLIIWVQTLRDFFIFPNYFVS